MGVHIYCVASPDHTPPDDLHGLDEKPVTAVETAGVALWATLHERPPQPGLDAVRTHDRVVRAATTHSHTPVPVRFGQWFENADAAVERAAAQAPHWQALLDRFAGRAEYGISLTSGDGPAREMHTAQSSTGTEYMSGLARRAADAARLRQQAERLMDQLADRAGPVLAASALTDGPGGTVSIVHLLAWDDVAAYHSIVDAVRSDTTLRLKLTGPWPPYSFVE